MAPQFTRDEGRSARGEHLVQARPPAPSGPALAGDHTVVLAGATFCASGAPPSIAAARPRSRRRRDASIRAQAPVLGPQPLALLACAGRAAPRRPERLAQVVVRAGFIPRAPGGASRTRSHDDRRLRRCSCPRAQLQAVHAGTSHAVTSGRSRARPARAGPPRRPSPTPRRGLLREQHVRTCRIGSLVVGDQMETQRHASGSILFPGPSRGEPVCDSAGRLRLPRPYPGPRRQFLAGRPALRASIDAMLRQAMFRLRASAEDCSVHTGPCSASCACLGTGPGHRT